jgi:hypothetical protein
MRGRCALPSEAQAAEVVLREQLGERGLDAIRWLGSDKGEGVVTVRLLHVPTRQEHSVSVTKRMLPAFPQSCGASHRPSETLVALTLR